MVSLEQIILLHIRGSGPVSFHSIVAYVHQQYGKVDDYQIAHTLTGLIRSGQVGLYDDGESFTCSVDH